MTNQELIDKYCGFLESQNKSVSTLKASRSTLGKFMVAAQNINVDIYNPTLDEVYKVLQHYGVCNHSVLKNVHNIIARFYKWMYDNEFSNNDIFNVRSNGQYLSIDLSEQIQKEYYKNPLDAKEYFDAIFRPTYENTIDNSYRTFLWLIYIGIPPREVAKIKKTDLNIKESCISYKEKKYLIPDEAIADIKWSYFNVAIIKNINGGYFYKDFVDKDMLVGSTGKNPYESIRYAFINDVNIPDDLTNKLSFSSVKYSGFFYLAYEEEQKSKDVNFLKLASELYLDGSTKYKGAEHCKQLQSDYRDWKKAFNL